MKPTVNCITLAIQDLQRSLIFYRDGLNLVSKNTNLDIEKDHLVIPLSEYLYLVLISRAEFAKYASIASQSPAPKQISECILSHFTDSNEQVDKILKQAVDAGGAMAQPPKTQQWGYAGYVTDPDGHIWEIMHNPKMNPKTRSGQEVDDEFRTASFGVC